MKFFRRRLGNANVATRLATVRTRFGDDTARKVIAILERNRDALWAEFDYDIYDEQIVPQELMFTETERIEPYIPWLAAQVHHPTRILKRAKVRHIKQMLAQPHLNHPELMNIYWNVYRQAFSVLYDEWGRIVDWAIHFNIDLGPLSLEQAIERTTAWHDSLPRGLNTSNLKGTICKVIYSWPTGWTFQQLTERELKRESEILVVCLWTRYREAGRNGEIYSLRDENNIPHVATRIQMNGWVEQVKGFEDATPAEWDEDDFNAWAPMLLEAITHVQPDQSKWSSEALELTGEGGWYQNLLQGNLREAEQNAPRRVARNISYLRDQLHYLDYSDNDDWVRIEWTAQNGIYTITWEQELAVLDEWARQIVKNEYDELLKLAEAEISREDWQKLVDGAFVLDKFEKIDANDPDEVTRLILIAIVQEMISGTFLIAKYVLKQIQTWTNVPSILYVSDTQHLDQTARFTADGNSVAASGIFKWDVPSKDDCEDMDEAIQEIRDAWEDNGVRKPDDMDSYTLADNFERAATALIEYMPVPINSQRAFFYELEARGQLRLPFPHGQGNRAANGDRIKRNRYQLRIMQWRKHWLKFRHKQLQHRKLQQQKNKHGKNHHRN